MKQVQQDGIYEVQSAGVTLEITDFITQAQEAYVKCHRDAILTKRTGSSKTVIASKRAKGGSVKEQLVSKGLMQ